MFNEILEKVSPTTVVLNSDRVKKAGEQWTSGAASDRGLERKEEEVISSLEIALAVLENGDFQEKWEVAKVLPLFGEVAIGPIIEIISDEDAPIELKWFALRILGEFDSPEAIASLVNLLHRSEEEELAEIAASTLANKGKNAIRALTELLERPESRLLATRALAEIRSYEAIAPLLTVVEDADVNVRATAVEALGSFHDPRVPPVLIAALKDSAAMVRKEAAIGLGFRTDLAGELDLLSLLLPLLYDLNIEVCQRTAIAIGKLQTEAAAKELFSVLQSPHTPVSLQKTLIQSLGWMSSKCSLQYLQLALDRVGEQCQLEIIRILGRIETAQLQPLAAQILLEWFESNQSAMATTAIKKELAHAWGQLGVASAGEAIAQLKQDADISVKLHAIAALKHLQSPTREKKA